MPQRPLIQTQPACRTLSLTRAKPLLPRNDDRFRSLRSLVGSVTPSNSILHTPRPSGDGTASPIASGFAIIPLTVSGICAATDKGKGYYA